MFDEEYNNKHDLNDYENSKLSNTFIKNNNEAKLITMYAKLINHYAKLI